MDDGLIGEESAKDLASEMGCRHCGPSGESNRYAINSCWEVKAEQLYATLVVVIRKLELEYWCHDDEALHHHGSISRRSLCD